MARGNLETYWAKRLGEVERWASPTIASGAIFGDEDVRSPRFLSQCKETTKHKNLIIAKGDWDQLHAAALKERTPDGREYKVGLFVVESSYHGDIAVAMEHEDFLGLVEKLVDAENRGLPWASREAGGCRE